jgi:chromosome segregation ATPase
MDAQQVVRLLTIANDDLPSVEYRYEKLKREEASLKTGNQNSARTLQELSDLISTTQNTLEQYESDCEEKRLKITKLQLQKIRLEALVNDFQDNNEEYIKITRAVEDEVLGVLSNAKVLLIAVATASHNNHSTCHRIIILKLMQP